MLLVTRFDIHSSCDPYKDCNFYEVLAPSTRPQEGPHLFVCHFLVHLSSCPALPCPPLCPVHPLLCLVEGWKDGHHFGLSRALTMLGNYPIKNKKNFINKYTAIWWSEVGPVHDCCCFYRQVGPLHDCFRFASLGYWLPTLTHVKGLCMKSPEGSEALGPL